MGQNRTFPQKVPNIGISPDVWLIMKRNDNSIQSKLDHDTRNTLFKMAILNLLRWQPSPTLWSLAAHPSPGKVVPKNVFFTTWQRRMSDHLASRLLIGHFLYNFGATGKKSREGGNPLVRRGLSKFCLLCLFCCNVCCNGSRFYIDLGISYLVL